MLHAQDRDLPPHLPVRYSSPFNNHFEPLSFDKEKMLRLKKRYESGNFPSAAELGIAPRAQQELYDNPPQQADTATLSDIAEPALSSKIE